jgi:hypothetical protein
MPNWRPGAADILRAMPPRARAGLSTLDGIKAWLNEAVRDDGWNVRGIVLDAGRLPDL